MREYGFFNKNKLNIFDIPRISFNYAYKESLLLTIFSFINGIIPLISLMAISSFIDSVSSIYYGNSSYSSFYFSLIFIIFCLLYFSMSSILIDNLAIRFKNRISENLGVDLIEIVASLKYKYFEDGDFLDLLSRVSHEPETNLSKAYIDLLKAISLFIKIIGIMVILFVKIPMATIIIGLISFPSFILADKAGKINYKANIEKEIYQRRVTYFTKLLRDRFFANERNIFKFSTYINIQWYKNYNLSRKIKLKAHIKWLIGSEVTGLLTSFLIASVILILLNTLKDGKIGLGLFISVVNSIISMIPDLSWQLPEYTESLSNSVSYINDLSKLFDLEKDFSYLSLPSNNNVEIKSIEFKNVSFKYPNTKDYIIINLSFRMEGSRSYAFVGKNGSGKSTIIKLLTGMYDDYVGEILINGVSIKNYKADEIKSMFSVVYQDYSRYDISLRENIEVGNIENIGERSNEQRLLEIIEKFELSDLISRLSRGIDTPLGKLEQDGVDISGGQWQKLAIARSLINNRPIRILDEPSSALDPFSEKALYEIFNQENKDKLTILISHRLASTVFSDKIFVLDGGKLVEEGDFKSLLGKGGIYQTMFNKQKQWYKDEK